MFSPRYFAILALIFAAAATRLLPHPPNFTAVGAIALFGGVYLHGRGWALAIPLLALFLSDIGLSLMWFGGTQWSFNLVTYGLFCLTVLLGMSIRERTAPGRIMFAGIAATCLFFVISNAHVWYGGDGKLYPHTIAGLVACYVAAIPFAQNMLQGNVFYGTILFGSWQLLKNYLPETQELPGGRLAEAATNR